MCVVCEFYVCAFDVKPVFNVDVQIAAYVRLCSFDGGRAHAAGIDWPRVSLDVPLVKEQGTQTYSACSLLGHEADAFKSSNSFPAPR